MRSLIINAAGKSRSILATLCALALGLFCSTVVYAQTPTPALDYGAYVDATKDEAVLALGDVMPVAFALLAILLGVGIAWKFAKRAVKSS